MIAMDRADCRHLLNCQCPSFLTDDEPMSNPGQKQGGGKGSSGSGSASAQAASAASATAAEEKRKEEVS